MIFFDKGRSCARKNFGANRDQRIGWVCTVNNRCAILLKDSAQEDSMDRLIVRYARLSFRQKLAVTVTALAPVLASLIALSWMGAGVARGALAFGTLLYLTSINTLFFLYDARR